MKLKKTMSIIFCAAVLLSMAACGGNGSSSSSTAKEGNPSVASQEPSSSSMQESTSSEPASSSSVSSGPTLKGTTLKSTPSAKQAASKTSSAKSQSGSEWVAYDDANHNLHIKRKDGTEDKIIVKDIDMAPCVAGEWVYYFADLSTIEKVKLDGSQKTKVCDADAMDALNANTAVTAEYKDGYILYKMVQLREVGDNKPHTVTYYKLDLKSNKITTVKN